MSPDNAAQDFAKLLKTINDIYPEDVVQTHLGSSARCSNAKQVPELPPATKKEAPKARKSKGMGPAKSSQGVSDTEPSSADSQASPKSVADNKKARCTVPPPLPAHAPKMQHYIAQDLQPPPRPPPGPPNMQHYLEQCMGSVWDEPEEPEPRPPEYLGQNYKICWNKQWHGLATLKVWHGLAEESERKKGLMRSGWSSSTKYANARAAKF